MTLTAVWLLVVVALLVGYVPLAGTEEERPTYSSSFSSDWISNSNCSQLTLKLDFSSKVVEHGKWSHSLFCFCVPYRLCDILMYVCSVELQQLVDKIDNNH